MRSQSLIWENIHESGTWEKLSDAHRTAILGMMHWAVNGLLRVRHVEAVTEWAGVSRSTYLQARSILLADRHLECVRESDGRIQGWFRFVFKPHAAEKKTPVKQGLSHVQGVHRGGQQISTVADSRRGSSIYQKHPPTLSSSNADAAAVGRLVNAAEGFSRTQARKFATLPPDVIAEILRRFKAKPQRQRTAGMLGIMLRDDAGDVAQELAERGRRKETRRATASAALDPAAIEREETRRREYLAKRRAEHDAAEARRKRK